MTEFNQRAVHSISETHCATDGTSAATRQAKPKVDPPRSLSKPPASKSVRPARKVAKPIDKPPGSSFTKRDRKITRAAAFVAIPVKTPPPDPSNRSAIPTVEPKAIPPSGRAAKSNAKPKESPPPGLSTQRSRKAVRPAILIPKPEDGAPGTYSFYP